jgi:GTP-binding protein Era
MGDFRSGFVTIVGRPNAGKSTLLNKLVGEKVAIVTHKPQTTRHRIQGIVNVRPRKDRPAAQIVFVDTPGIHKPDSQLGKRMMQEVYDALESRDVILLIVDASAKFGTGDQFALDLVKRAQASTILLLNKIDLVEKSKLLPLIDSYRQLHDFDEVIPISARKGSGTEELLDAVAKRLPRGPKYFSSDEITDQPVRVLAAEIIREKILMHLGEEVPYASAVIVERYEDSPKLVRISAAIYVERDGQKAIVIGKGGAMLKKIGSSARFELEKLTGTKIFLELFVKVAADWRSSKRFVEELDWRKQMEDLGQKSGSGEI